MRLKIIIYIFVFCIVGLYEASLASAQNNRTGGDQLKALVEEALRDNPQIRAAESLLRAAESRVPQASSLPDPMAGYSYMGRMMETRLGPQEEVYEFEQEIPFPGKLLEKRKMAQADVDSAAANLLMTQKEVLLKVTQTYFDLLAVKETLMVTEEVQELLESLEDVAQSRYAGGSGSQKEVVGLQLEISRTLKEIFDLRQQQDSLSGMLGALLNRSDPISVIGELEESLPALDQNLDDLLNTAYQSRPELLIAKAMNKRESHAHRLAKYENAPDFKIGFQYTQIGSGMTSNPDDGRDAWMIPIKVSLPIWRGRIDSAVEEARNNLKASDANLQAEQIATDYEVKNAYYQWKAKRQTVDLYGSVLLPQEEISRRSAEAGYKSGEISIIEFLENQREYLDAKILYFRALADAQISYAVLERELGVSLAEANPE